MGAANAVLDHVAKQSSNNKVIRKQSGKRVVLSSSDSLRHNSDSNALPYVGTLTAAPIQMQMAGYCKEWEVSLPFHHVQVLCRVTHSSGHSSSPTAPPSEVLTLWLKGWHSSPRFPIGVHILRLRIQRLTAQHIPLPHCWSRSQAWSSTQHRANLMDNKGSPEIG